MLNYFFPFQRTVKELLNYNKLKYSLKKDNWNFSHSKINMINKETKEWEKYYLPINIKNKIVLDVGAGEGETARFFLQYGAKKVISIENNKQYLKNLLINALNHPKIEVIYGSFLPFMINYEFDFMKCDIEGYEEILLDYTELLKYSVIEVHGLQLATRFSYSGFRKIDTSQNNCNCTNIFYWKC